MQGPIIEALALTMVGNACLAGRDVSAFWPNSGVFTYTKTCEFRRPPFDAQGEAQLYAADPLAWFSLLRHDRRGFRLHHMERPLQPGQMPGVEPRMLVAFVGGGPRWMIEAVGEGASELWEGFNRFGDRKDPNQKIWLTTYLSQGEIDASDAMPETLDGSLDELGGVLADVEAFARAESYDNFAECFARARQALDGAPAPVGWRDELAGIAGMTDRQSAVLQACQEAWVFGGMGSWNDLPGGERYDELSQHLFVALCDTVCGLANSSYRA